MGKDKKNRVGEENKIRAYFVRLFGRYDFRNEEQFRYFGKWLFFILLLLVETLVLLQQLGDFLERRNWVNFIASGIVVLTLTLSMALQFFAASTIFSTYSGGQVYGACGANHTLIRPSAVLLKFSYRRTFF